MVSCLLGLQGDTEFLSMLDSDRGVSSSLLEYLDNKNGMLSEMPAVLFYDANSCKQNKEKLTNQSNGESNGNGHSSHSGMLLGNLLEVINIHICATSLGVQGGTVELRMCIRDICEDLTYANVAYFIPNTPQPVPLVDSQSEAKLLMGELFEYGSIPGNSLKALEGLLSHVYLPLFQAGAVGKDTFCH